MPNIEMHGYGTGDKNEFFENRAAADAKHRIWDALKSATYIGDVVVTDFFDTCANHKGEKQPYLRIVASGEAQETVADIEKRLASEFDIEVMQLLRFTPKKAPSE